MSTSADTITFEEALGKLEQIVQKLESSELSLQDSVKQFEEGIKLSRHCSQILEQAELRVEQVKQNENQA
ncbi:MAG: exodeoxyribonuclease VII small subunit [Balneolia bacterium]|nr:exodeoxyribonuclease VII small subunit [Balneolia bacterium]